MRTGFLVTSCGRAMMPEPAPDVNEVPRTRRLHLPGRPGCFTRAPLRGAASNPTPPASSSRIGTSRQRRSGAARGAASTPPYLRRQVSVESFLRVRHFRPGVGASNRGPVRRQPKRARPGRASRSAPGPERQLAATVDERSGVLLVAPGGVNSRLPPRRARRPASPPRATAARRSRPARPVAAL